MAMHIGVLEELISARVSVRCDRQQKALREMRSFAGQSAFPNEGREALPPDATAHELAASTPTDQKVMIFRFSSLFWRSEGERIAMIALESS